jgi:hypothetical protein
MNRHRLNYLDLHPEPLETVDDEPSTCCIVLGMAVAIMAVVSIVLFAFSL